MKCQQIQGRLDEYLDGELGLPEEVELHVHLDSCAHCRQRFQAANALQTDLQALNVPGMRPGFAQQAIRRAVSQIAPPVVRRERRGFFIGLSSALVAGLAMLVLVVGLLPGSGTMKDVDPMPEVVISLAEPHTVNLVFDVANAVDMATLSLDLPDHVEVVGYPGLRRLSWQTSLAQGRNILPLPLKGTADANAELVATLAQGNKIKTFHVRVRVNTQIAPQAEVFKLSWV